MKLLLVGIDGLRLDVAVPELLDRPGFESPDHASDPRFSCGAPDRTRRDGPTLAPTLARLVSQGWIAPLWMTPPTDSGPGWASLLTGTTHEQNNVWWNELVAHRLDVCPDILTRVAAASPTARTMAIASWPPLVAAAGPGPILRRDPARELTGRHTVVELDGSDPSAADAAAVRAATWHLNHEGPDASFVYLLSVDEAGHAAGADSDLYRAAAHQADEGLRSLLQAVTQRVEQLGEQWLVAVVTDHGHKPDGGHGEDEVEVRRSFLAVATFGAPLPDRPARPLRSHEVASLLLAAIGVQEGSWPDHEASVARDVVTEGPSRSRLTEW